MQRIGLGFVAIGAFAWIITGLVIFTSGTDRSVITEGLVESGPATLTAAAYIGLGHGLYGNEQDPTAYSEKAWGGVRREREAQESYDQERVVPLPAWYVSVFNGFGSVFQQLFSPHFNRARSAPSPSISIPHSGEGMLSPACVVTITPSSVPYGGSATLSWTTRNASTVVLQGHGKVSRSGSLTIKQLTSSRAFALAVAGEGGASSCYTVIDVGALITPIQSSAL